MVTPLNLTGNIPEYDLRFYEATFVYFIYAYTTLQTITKPIYFISRGKTIATTETHKNSGQQNVYAL